MLFIKAYAELTGAQRYDRAVRQQVSRATGASASKARNIVRANAGGRQAFAPTRGRRSTNTNVMRRAISFNG